MTIYANNPSGLSAALTEVSGDRTRLWFDGARIVTSGPSYIVEIDYTGGVFVQSGVSAAVRSTLDKMREAVSVKDFGAVCDGITDDSAAVQAAIDYLYSVGGGTLLFPSGNTRVERQIDTVKSGAKNITLEGSGAAVVSTTSNIIVFLIAELVSVKNLRIVQSGTQKTGRAFSTPANKQIANNRFERVTVEGFKYGWWIRYSLWATWDTIKTIDCACGIKFSRNAYPDDNTNPAAPGGWNIQGGYFHNENMLSNVLCAGGEVGILGTVNGCVFDAVTCQNQTTSGASNVVLPAGIPGVGMWLQGSADTPGSTFGSQGNLVSHFYAEYTRQPMIFDRAQVRLESFFVQGGPSDDRYNQAIKAVNGAVINGEGCAASGADWFDYQVVATDSTIRGAIGAGAAAGSRSSLVNSSWYRGAGSGAGVNQYFEASAAAPRVIYSCPSRVGAVAVHCTVIRDGLTLQYGRWTVYFYQSGMAAVIADAGNSTTATVTVTGSDITYAHDDPVNHSVIANAVPLAMLGQTRTSGLYSG